MENSQNRLQTKDLERVIDTLQAVYDICQQKRRLCEQVSKDCRQLFKPWPKKKTLSENRDQTQATTTHPQSKETKCPTEEEVGLDLVQKALAKAEKTRNRFQEKLITEDVNKNPSLSSEGLANLSEAKDDSEAVPCRTEGKSSQSTIQPTGKQRPGSGRDKLRTNSVISQSYLNSVAGHVTKKVNSTSRVNSGSSRGTSNVRVSATSHVGSAGRVGATGRVNPTGRVTATSRVNNPSRVSAKTKYTPVYATAPFKTSEPRRTRGTIIRVKSADTSRPNSGKIPATKISNDSHLSKIEKPTSDVPKFMENSVMENAINEKSVERTSEVLPELEKLSLKDEAGTEKVEESSAERFDLVKDGKRLTFPSKFNKLMAQNRRLRDQIDRGMMKAKNVPTPCSNVFMDRLTDSINVDTSQEARRLREVLSMTSVYNNLHKLLLQVQKIVSTTGDMPWQDVLCCKKKLELVLGTFASLEENYRISMSQVPDGYTCDKHVDVTYNYPASTLYWLPDHIGTVPVSAACLKYTTRRHLTTYMNMLYQVQILRLEIYTLNQMEHIIACLRQATGDESWFVPVYRGLFSMGCSVGQVFPTIVTDTIDAMEEDDDDPPFDNDF